MLSCKRCVYLTLLLGLFSSPLIATVNPCPLVTAASTCQSLEPLLLSSKERFPILQRVLANSEQFKVQILYTRVQETLSGPLLHYYFYNVQPDQYFYPASTVKLPIAALALQWVAEQDNPALTVNTIMLTDVGQPPQTAAHHDVTAPSGLPSIEHYIKKIFLVSDNDASNRLYELLGQQYINQQLRKKGLLHTVINHRLSVPFSDDDNRYFNPIRFLNKRGNLVLAIPQRSIEQSYFNHDLPTLGKAYYNKDELIAEPMNFTLKNRQSLLDFDGVIKRIILPDLFTASQRFGLDASQRSLLLNYMKMMPRESDHPVYDEQSYPDTYVKYYLLGGQRRRFPTHLNYYNKNGQAFGHVIDGAYIEDTKHQLSFFITAVIYTNENQILNDDNYQTDTLGQPFMAELGQLLYEHAKSFN